VGISPYAVSLACAVHSRSVVPPGCDGTSSPPHTGGPPKPSPSPSPRSLATASTASSTSLPVWEAPRGVSPCGDSDGEDCADIWSEWDGCDGDDWADTGSDWGGSG
jgi:hypothetical protein